MKGKIIVFLYWLLNKLKAEEYYEFGSPVVGVMEYEGRLIVATKSGVFLSYDGKIFVQGQSYKTKGTK